MDIVRVGEVAGHLDTGEFDRPVEKCLRLFDAVVAEYLSRAIAKSNEEFSTSSLNEGELTKFGIQHREGPSQPRHSGPRCIRAEALDSN